jgi:hypothetical protein
MAEKPGTAISRREFTRRAAIASAFGSAVASVAPASLVGGEFAREAMQTPPPENQTPASPPTAAPALAQAQLPASMPRLSPESQAEADARFQAILEQYGDRFTEQQKTDLGRLCAVAQPPLDRLRAYPVQNSDGIALYLKPLFEREKKPKPPAASKPAASKPAVGATQATGTPATNS